ncbi:BREX-1 system phosphatase PglZ type A [Candidatus Methanoprimaticola sp. MG2]|uniref:BREX-1 system phosphatase PglZ type A n=1 Tax=Candidatus Methanoprimaticola sp. MG2 TaxID=3228838 RepID=UPI0039C73E32
MESDEVTSMLMARFDTISSKTGVAPRIVFWSDPKREFSDAVDYLELGDIKIIKWDGFNGFYIKYTIEVEQKEARFLVYMPGAIPPDEDNILADTIHYSKPLFTADKTACICTELGLSESCNEVVNDHVGFFNSVERKRKFLRLQPKEDDPDSVLDAMLAVSLGVNSMDFTDILSDVLVRYSDSPELETDTAILNLIDDYGLSDCFWDHCKEEFGYIGTRSIRDLSFSLFITAATYSTPLVESPKLSNYILRNGLRTSTVMRRILNDSSISFRMRSLSDWISERIDLSTVLRAFEPSAVIGVGVFSCVDDVIVDRFIDQISSTRSPLDNSAVRMIDERLNMIDSDAHRFDYDMVLSASRLLRLCNEYSSDVINTTSVDRMIDRYSDGWNGIDREYRHFIKNSDRSGSSNLEVLCNLVENTYSNQFLNPVTERLCSMIRSYDDLPGPAQTDFCKSFIEKGRKTVVIISDAFRYECAVELMENLGKNSRYRDCSIKHMISTVPSITKFGMAALLPNDGLEVSHDGKYNVLICGQSTESGTREAVLNSVYPDSAVIRYSDMGKGKKTELRERCKGKDLIYVYHDAIDATGDEARTESKAFDACDDAIREIEDIICTITNWNYTKFIITADHGFIYRRRDMQEIDKISAVEGFQSGRRYALNDRRFGLDRSIEFSLDYLDESNSGLYVSVPDSAGLFKLQGGGQNFVHGGISLQEIVVPVVTVFTNKGAVTEKYVGLKTDGKRDVKQMSPRFVLLQEHPVNNEYREAEYSIWIEDMNGQRISEPQKVVANRVDPTALDIRITFKVELKVNMIRLVVRNLTDPDEEPKRFDYKVNVMFADLGF